LKENSLRVDLEGKFALVTGAARGIGEAIANTLAANGARVAYADIDFDTAKKTAAKVLGSLPVAIDISSESGVESAMAEVMKQFGRVDILVNNAGVNTAKYRVNIDQFPLEEWERIVKIDLTGTYLVSRAASRIMMQQREGRIVNISSVLGVIPARLQCAFTSAKAGVVHLTRTLAIELGEYGILVNCVAPGSTLTEGTKQLFYSSNAAEKDRATRLLSHVPLGRAGTVQEMANAVLFFAAPDSSYITGQTLCVDGGWSAGGFFRDF
jgi:NAD(P)-dependent dehydrogenase (short-subunit alcohol dehydrogenase family)